jgi:hypothetical protein
VIAPAFSIVTVLAGRQPCSCIAGLGDIEAAQGESPREVLELGVQDWDDRVSARKEPPQPMSRPRAVAFRPPS